MRTSDRGDLPPHSYNAAPEDNGKAQSMHLSYSIQVPKKKLLFKVPEWEMSVRVCVCVYLVQHFCGVCSRHAEASSGLCDRRCWKADHHDADFSLQHFSSKSPEQHQEQGLTHSAGITLSFFLRLFF